MGLIVASYLEELVFSAVVVAAPAPVSAATGPAAVLALVSAAEDVAASVVYSVVRPPLLACSAVPPQPPGQHSDHRPRSGEYSDPRLQFV